MTDIDLNFVARKLDHVLDELRAVRNEQRQLSENQVLMSKAINSLCDDLKLMIRTKIGGLGIRGTLAATEAADNASMKLSADDGRPLK